MKSLAIAACGLAVTAVAVSTAALAADLPTYKAPPPPAPFEAPPAPLWTGFYIGGFAGGSFGGDSQSYTVSSTWLSANLPALLPFVDGVGSQNLGLRGADLGLEAGYDWSVANRVVFGVAGDVSWSDLSGARTTAGTLPFVGLPYSISEKLNADFFGSLRLRAGVTPVDNLLLYATGGPAFGHFTYASSFWDNLVPPFAPGTETESVSLHAFRIGWTVGAGAEWAFSRNWSVGGEYRFSDYAAVTGTGVLPLQQPPSTAYINHSTGDIKVNSLRLGVNYRFN